jgi:hypothetical protein
MHEILPKEIGGGGGDRTRSALRRVSYRLLKRAKYSKIQIHASEVHEGYTAYSCCYASSPIQNSPQALPTALTPQLWHSKRHKRIQFVRFSAESSNSFSIHISRDLDVSGHTVIRPESMPSAEITSYKPTSRYRSAYPELDYFRIADNPEVIWPPRRSPLLKTSVLGSTCS